MCTSDLQLSFDISANFLYTYFCRAAFGSTSTVNPISTSMGFCDGDDTSTEKAGRKRTKSKKKQNRNLACLEEIYDSIELSKGETDDPWKEFPALRLLLKDRVDYDSAFPTIKVEREYCEEKESSPCNNQTSINFGAREVQRGDIFRDFSEIWRERNDPLGVKFDQLKQSWWHTDVPNMLESTPDRPHIKHVIMAYGTGEFVLTYFTIN